MMGSTIVGGILVSRHTHPRHLIHRMQGLTSDGRKVLELDIQASLLSLVRVLVAETLPVKSPSGNSSSSSNGLSADASMSMELSIASEDGFANDRNVPDSVSICGAGRGGGCDEVSRPNFRTKRPHCMPSYHDFFPETTTLGTTRCVRSRSWHWESFASSTKLSPKRV